MFNIKCEKKLDISFDILKRYKSPYNLIRLGVNRDGGYVLADDIKYDFFISGGVGGDVSFENDFINRYKIDCFAYDGSVNELPFHQQNNRIKFIKKYIGFNETETETNLHDILLKYNNIFLKMDIEEGEFNFLPSLTNKMLENISQIVIEIHLNLSSDVDEYKWNCFNILGINHKLIHIHGNNYGEYIKINDIELPETIECTFLNNKYFTNEEYNKSYLPIIQDKPNNPYRPDYSLTYLSYI